MAPMRGDPGQRAFDDPAAGQDLEGVRALPCERLIRAPVAYLEEIQADRILPMFVRS
jgi:hypothetical protein